MAAYAFFEVSARTISAHMLGRQCKKSLNEISHGCAAALIRKALSSGINVKSVRLFFALQSLQVYVDTVGPEDTYQELLKKKFPQLEIVVASKADALYPVVGAASIVAKVTRDARLHAQCGTGVGSGYPGDEPTKRFLADSVSPLFGYGPSVRFSWGTTTSALAKASVPCRW